MPTKAEEAFQEMRGCEGPLVVDGYQYPLLVLPVRQNASDPTYWQRPGYAALPVPPGFEVYLRAAVSNERVPVLMTALIVFHVGGGGRPIVQRGDDFFIGPAVSAGQLYSAFDRRKHWLTNDGLAGFGAIANGPPSFVVFADVFKHVRIYAGDGAKLAPLTAMLEREHGLARDDRMPFLSDVPCARGSAGSAVHDDLADELTLEPWTPPPFLR
jgi:hypothetical protein